MEAFGDGSEEKGNELVVWARGRMNQCQTDIQDWRSDSTEAYGLVAGDQWDESDRNDLEADDRPVFTFNRVAGFVRGICGLETSTRTQAQVFAREVSDSGAADVRNAAIRYVREGCDADDEESDAFKDMLICGLGWTETLFTTEEDPEGQIVIERVDPLHMRWDTSARKRGLADRRWCARIKWLPYETIKDVWGKEKADQLQGQVTTDTEFLDELFGKVHDATDARNYDSDGGNIVNNHNIPVIQFQYVKTAHFHVIINPLTGEREEVDEDEFGRLEELFASQDVQLESQRIKRRQYRQLIYSGCTELEEGELPCRGFTLQAITGIRDRNNGTWYGFIRDLLDPQRWINKFFSSMADVVASQAKGGLLAEADAFVDKANAEADWANPRSIVWLKRDGLNKIKERVSAGVPAGINQLLEFTLTSLPNVAGVNLEFLGMASREQPGVLEHQRKQAAIATLAEFFNALRLYRKQQTRVLLQFIDEFISDARLIRIVGKKDAKYVALTKTPGSLKYDVVVDEAPTSPDQKERTWGALVQILPIAANMGLPIPPEVIEYAPFPQALIDDWLKFANGEGGMPPQARAKMQQMEEQLGAMQKENQKLKSKQEETMAKLQMDQAQSQQAMQLKAVEQQGDQALAEQKFQAEMALKLQEFQANQQLEREKFQAQMELEYAKIGANSDLESERMVHEDYRAGIQAESDSTEGDGQPAARPKVKRLTDVLETAQNETAQAMAALSQAVQALLEAQTKPRTITDGKGKTFTVTQG